MDAQAAIDKAVDMGVVDRDRIGVFGHSYGAFMTANPLAHTKLFHAAVAESGAYNRTLTPFGFQAERRTFWEAPEVYTKMSPFWYADKIRTPLLLIHGEADDNMPQQKDAPQGSPSVVFGNTSAIDKAAAKENETCFFLMVFRSGLYLAAVIDSTWIVLVLASSAPTTVTFCPANFSGACWSLSA
jgi:hypothetical protein